MKKVLLFLLLGLFPSFLLAQEECGTTTSRTEYNKASRQVRSLAMAKTSTPIQLKEIPIVFHIFYSDSIPNSYVPREKVVEAFYDINRNFIGTKFRFRLVDIKYKNLAEFSWHNDFLNGSTNLPTKNHGRMHDLANSTYLDPNYNLNIYICPKFSDPNLRGLSFTTPYAPVIGQGLKPADGVWIRTDVFGLNLPYLARHGTLNKVVVHEIGHYLGLFHTFQGSTGCEPDALPLDCTTTGDLVCDTRPIRSSVMASHCNPRCPDNWTPGKPWENYTYDNFMDYLADDCRHSFTPGQIERMHQHVTQQRPNVYQTISPQQQVDLDKNQNIGSSDMLLLLACINQPIESKDCYLCDFDFNKVVGVSDLQILLSHMGTTYSK